MRTVTPTNPAAGPQPSAAERLRRVLQIIDEIESRLHLVLCSDEPHGVVHLGELEASAATAGTTIAGFDREAAQATIAAALRPATRKEIAEMAASVVGCFPSAGKYDLTVFGTVLPRELGDREPLIGALELGFKTVVARARSLAIPEVVAAVEAAQAKLIVAAGQIPKLEEQLTRAQARLDHLRDRARQYHAWCERRQQA